MAASSLSQLAKNVQEVTFDGDELPTRYIRRDKDDVPIDASMSSSIPIIDLHRLSDEKEIEKLKSALSTWGLFQAIGHDIASTVLDDVRRITKEFFDLPLEEKNRFSVHKDGTEDYLEGYGNDVTVSEDQVLEWSDRLYLLVRPHDQRKMNLWPDIPNRFREILNEYSAKANFVAQLIYKSMAKSLGLEQDHFLNQVGERSSAFIRFNYYPPCPKPDLVYGFKPHTDGGSITIVLQDEEVEGLQVLKDNRWVKVPIIPHALLVNVADQVEIMSNGVFKSPIHRVITNSEKPRISLAMFQVPELDKDIEPAVKLITESTPRLFKKINVKEYGDIFFQKFSRGERAIDWARI